MRAISRPVRSCSTNAGPSDASSRCRPRPKPIPGASATCCAWRRRTGAHPATGSSCSPEALLAVRYASAPVSFSTLASPDVAYRHENRPGAAMASPPGAEAGQEVEDADGVLLSTAVERGLHALPPSIATGGRLAETGARDMAVDLGTANTLVY